MVPKRRRVQAKALNLSSAMKRADHLFLAGTFLPFFVRLPRTNSDSLFSTFNLAGSAARAAFSCASLVAVHLTLHI
jgi:hypothetical protein